MSLETPRYPDRVSSFLNIRVSDIHAVYEEWSARGGEFLTPLIQRTGEIRCYMRSRRTSDRGRREHPPMMPALASGSAPKSASTSP